MIRRLVRRVFERRGYTQIHSPNLVLFLMIFCFLDRTESSMFHFHLRRNDLVNVPVLKRFKDVLNWLQLWLILRGLWLLFLFIPYEPSSLSHVLIDHFLLLGHMVLIVVSIWRNLKMVYFLLIWVRKWSFRLEDTFGRWFNIQVHWWSILN